MGSGGDVATCVYGVPIKFRTADDKYNIAEINAAKSANRIPMNLLWTGKSANTRDMVNRFHKWVESGGYKARDLMAKLIEASDNLADAWYSVSQADLFGLLDKFDSIITVWAHG